MSAKTSTPPQAYTRETLTKAFEWMKSQPESIKDKIVSADSLVRLYLHSKRFGSPTLALLDDRQPNLEDLISVENFKQDLKDLAQGLKQFEEPADTNVPFQARPVDLSASVKTSAAVTEPRPSTKSVDSGRMQEQNYAYSSRIAEHTAPQSTTQRTHVQTPTAPSYQPQQNHQQPQQNHQQPQQNHQQPQQNHQQPQQNYQPPQQSYQSLPPKEGSMNYSQQVPPSQAWNQPMNESTMGPTLTLGWDEKTFMAVKAVKERFNLSSDQEALRMLVATGFDRLREGFLKGF